MAAKVFEIGWPEVAAFTVFRMPVGGWISYSATFYFFFVFFTFGWRVPASWVEG